MTGFYMPNYGGLSFGLPQLQAPQSFSMPNFSSPSAYSTNSPNFATNMPQPVTGMNPDQLRLAGLSNQMQPNSFLPYVGMGIQGVNTLGNLFLGFRGLQQANQAAAWQRDMAERNYDNSVLAYNTAAGDRVTGRYAPSSDPATQARIEEEKKNRQIGGR